MIRITATQIKAGYEVSFKYDGEIYRAIKAIDDSYWLPTKRVWIVPKKRRDELKRVMARFNKIEFDGNMVVGPMQIEMLSPDQYTADKTLPNLDIAIPLRKELRGYQGTGVAYALQKQSCLMGDQQGLGKTITAIAAVTAENAFPALVICKSSLQKNWENEINAWSLHRVMRFNDSVKRSWPNFFTTGYCHWGVCSYDSLRKFFVQEILDYKGMKQEFKMKHIIHRPEFSIFKSIIVDESHLIKDESTLRTKITVSLCLKRQHVYLLSGTPVLNDPVELYPQLVAMGKSHHFGDRDTFHAMYGKSADSREKALPYLNYLLHRHCYFRRLKSEVATEIPPKTRQVILCEISNREEYDMAEKEFARFLEERMQLSGGQIDKALRAEVLVKIGYLKHLSAKGKMQTLLDWLDDLADQGEKSVVFVYHKDIQQEVYDQRREGTVRLCGTAKPDILDQRKQQFQTLDSVQRIICSIMADAEGHTLTAASYLAMYELPWHFGKAEQCEDRIHRIGTEYPVTICYFLGDNTIDRKIYDLIMEKKDIHDTITGTDEDVQNVVVDKLISLFNQH